MPGASACVAIHHQGEEYGEASVDDRRGMPPTKLDTPHSDLSRGSSYLIVIARFPLISITFLSCQEKGAEGA